MIGLKQKSNQTDWTTLLAVHRTVPDEVRADKLVNDAVQRVADFLKTVSEPCFGWSGGKDSQVLRLVCEKAGLFRNVLVISGLEYPAFLRWASDEMPWECSVEMRPLDMDWLKSHEHMLFPQDADTAATWFSQLQHAGQRRFCKREGIDSLVLGRRKIDGNHVGKNGLYTPKDGITRFSPLADWTHDDLLCVIGAYRLPLPPCYKWPRGFQVGTGPWAARQWTKDTRDGWREVYEIDPGVVANAADADILGAKEFLCAV